MLSARESRADYFLPQDVALSAELLKKYRILIFVCLLTSVLAFGFFVFSLIVGFPVGVYTMAASSVLMLALLFASRAGFGCTLVANIYVAIILVDTALLITSSGGLSTSMAAAYVAIVPMLAVMLIDQKAGYIWFGVVVVETVALGLAQILGVEFPVTFDQRFDPAFKLAAFLGLVVIVFFVVRDFDSTTRRAQLQVEEEQQRTQSLLLNILPEEVAEELKATGQAQAREFDDVTILFSDFSNFTEISAGMTAHDLVTELNTCFFAFDAITRDHDLEKIKTIGDAYMAASGLALAGTSSAGNAVRAALGMQAFLDSYNSANRVAGKPVLEMRAGIHTGPVVAGVVGAMKFQYDIWGDTVNTASRMETNSEPGRVNISEATYSKVKDEPGLTFTPRDAINVKGKGALIMYYVEAS
ncbi:MAG: adenylate/guanylate cyclase domain-containing protein [Acidimicrobiia bacterium]